ncbi:MAG: hypothetical protein Ct9H300mP11_06980 [Chloroflexota bacterium]|nr:MAG: hypothetical protein Ct9H300mP11_06980 [Chloroflexota bacterium]
MSVARESFEMQFQKIPAHWQRIYSTHYQHESLICWTTRYAYFWIRRQSSQSRVPDIVMTNMSDVVDHCRRITRMVDTSLMVDAEDGFGNAVNVTRTVREMEAAGVAAIEIEDNFVPSRFNVQDPGLVSKEEQEGKLRAAVAARTDPSTFIVARSAAFGLCPIDEAIDRLTTYSQTGAEGVMLTGVKSREQIEAAHSATSLPIFILNPPLDARNDPDFLAANGVRILMLGNPTFAAAVKSIYDTLKYLKEGTPMENLSNQLAPIELLKAVNRTDEFIGLQNEYVQD